MTDQPATSEPDVPQERAARSGATSAAVPDPPSADEPATGQAMSASDDSTDREEGTDSRDDTDDADSRDDTDDADSRDDTDRRASAEEFAREHDPATHDIAAGEESRQRGDWTADEAGGPQVWDAEGHLVEGTSPAQPPTADQPTVDGAERESADDSGGSEDSGDAGDSGGSRRTSSVEEIRDGGYSVGSAALIDDGAMPLGHPVKAWEDSKTFLAPDHPGYGDGEPELWFTDPGAARRAGFHAAD